VEVELFEQHQEYAVKHMQLHTLSPLDSPLKISSLPNPLIFIVVAFAIRNLLPHLSDRVTHSAQWQPLAGRRLLSLCSKRVR
jgi:hypothetical protein